MSLSTSKSCLIEIVTKNNLAILNFGTPELIQRINEAATFTELYQLLIELNGKSSTLANSISTIASIPGSTCPGTEIINRYLLNAENFLLQDFTQFDKIGLTSSLTTNTKINIIDAINELQSQISNSGSVNSLSSLNTFDKTSLVASINELQSELKSTSGTQALSSLSTYDKTSLVIAINEIGVFKYSFSLALCSSAIGTLRLADSTTTPIYSAFAADLRNIFTVDSSLYNNNGCLNALQCIMKAGSSTLCAKNLFTNIQSGCPGGNLKF